LHDDFYSRSSFIRISFDGLRVIGPAREEQHSRLLKSAIASAAVIGNLELGQSAHLDHGTQGYAEGECRKDNNLCHNILLANSAFYDILYDPPR
jgi:hypothetical protein